MKFILTIAIMVSVFAFLGCAPKDTRDPTLILANSGDAQAQFEWAIKLESNSPGTETKKEIHQWLSNASDSNHTEAREHLSILLTEGYFGDELIIQGVEMLESLSAEGNPKSQSLYARLLEEGEFVEKNPERATELYWQASEKNDPYAIYRVAKLELEQDLNRSEELRYETMLRKAGEGGIGESYFLLAQRVEANGDNKIAEEWYYKAAKLDHPQAMYRSGIAYQRLGHHMTYAPLGFEYLSKAVEAGATDAVYPLSLSYRNGYGTDKDEAKANELRYISATLKLQKAINGIVLETFKIEKLSYDDNIELAAWMNWSPSLELKVKYAISERLEYSDDAFFKQVSYRTSQIGLFAKSYLSELSETAPRLSTEERATLETSYSARYGALEDIFLEARSDKTGVRQLELAKQMLDPNSPLHSPQEGIDWIWDSSRSGNKDAGIYAFKAFQDGLLEFEDHEADLLLKNSSDLGHPEAMFLKAQTQLEKAVSPKDYSIIVDLLLKSYEKGYEEADILARKLISEEKGIDYRNPRIRTIMQSFADEGETRFAYLPAVYDLEKLENQLRINSFPPVSNVGIEIAISSGMRNDILPGINWRKSVNNTKQETSPENSNTELKAAAQSIIDLAEQGDFDAKLRLSIWKFYGFYTPQDHNGAATLWKELHDLKPTEETNLIRSLCLFYGYKEEKDIMAAAQFARLSAEAGNRHAQVYFSDLNDKTELYSNILDTIHRATVLKEPKAMLSLSARYKNNSRFSKEESKQGYLKWIGEAAKNGNADAMATIGLVFLKGDGVEKNVTRGIRYLEESAKMGLAEAQYAVGFSYAMGDNVRKDIPKAIEYLKLAAEQGNLEAKTLLESVSSITKSADNESEEDDAVRNAFLSAAYNQDYFPIKPFAVVDGELQLITDARSNKGVYKFGKQTKSVRKKDPYVFLADDEFSNHRINISKQEISTPVIRTENGVIFTGNEPAIAFYYKSNHPLENCLCLLVVKNSEGAYTYNWRRIGKVNPNREYKTRFGLEDDFFDNEDLAIYFFENGEEILSDGRRQLQYFTQSGLDDFTKKRNDEIKRLAGGSAQTSPYKPISSYLYGFLESNRGTQVELQVSKLGFIKGIEISNAKDKDTKSKLLYQLSKVTLFPRIVDGELQQSKVRTTLE
jgi:TPR repeat protein